MSITVLPSKSSTRSNWHSINFRLTELSKLCQSDGLFFFIPLERISPIIAMMRYVHTHDNRFQVCNAHWFHYRILKFIANFMRLFFGESLVAVDFGAVVVCCVYLLCLSFCGIFIFINLSSASRQFQPLNLFF